MLVRELIEQLQAMKQDAEVLARVWDFTYDIEEAHTQLTSDEQHLIVDIDYEEADETFVESVILEVLTGDLIRNPW